MSLSSPTHIGASVSRIDGPAKVTGAAKYAAEYVAANLAHGYVVTSSIARGRIRRIDVSRARRVAGVIDVLTHDNRPDMAARDDAYRDDVGPDGAPFRPLYNDRILFSGQPIALVLAEDPEIARFAATLLGVDYEAEAHVTDFLGQREAAVAATKGAFGPPEARGSVEAALEAAAVRHDAEYYVPAETHNPMELYATTAIWDENGRLTVYDKT